jgi:hypothetical protein
VAESKVTRVEKHKSTAQMLATREDVLRLFGDLEDEAVLEILDMEPTIAELEELACWLEGSGDQVIRTGRPKSGRAAAILDIVDPPEEEPPWTR